MIKEVIKKVKEITDEKGIGVIYWKPEGAYVWSKYGLSCCGSDIKPIKVIEGFKK
jgi:arabinogalactan endo-1,4-beta-galactosidase